MNTATWPKEIRKIADDLLINPVQVRIGNADELAANKSITQYVEVVPPIEKQRGHEIRETGKPLEGESEVAVTEEGTSSCRRWGALPVAGDEWHFRFPISEMVD
ncbi:hypothetical protein L1887_31904 [Cichorium endivia]|nr:hypothetical protein L1887_31904 [Cichorium endivia]